uniref:Putative S-adenosylmethionine-dependent methyltransferase n=1 Tax=uncultured bacterium CSL142 TaxID=1091569 RepID=G4WVM2_9BACT|nr:putative S-adenosylmethionine-dependent methyltransferase [uncultured bacterium CSL142]
MPTMLPLISLVMRETLTGTYAPRATEPEAMVEPSQVDAFDREGSENGALLAIYHFNALAMSQLLPKDGKLLDLGCGSGRYVAYLAQHRPDITIVGIDLSEPMLSLGQHNLGQAGLDQRVHLKLGNMTRFADDVDNKIDLISGVFSLHHLPTADALTQCCQEIAQLRQKYGCGVWLFDFIRPRHPATAATFTQIFSPEASAVFNADTVHSLHAAFSFEEMSFITNHTFNETLQHAYSRGLNVYQAHWLKPQHVNLTREPWIDTPLAPQAAKHFKLLRKVLNLERSYRK